MNWLVLRREPEIGTADGTVAVDYVMIEIDHKSMKKTNFRLHVHALLLFLTTAMVLYPSVSSAQALDIAKKILEGAGTVVGAAGTLVGTVELFCKTSKGKAWQPSACKDSKLAERISDMSIAEMEEFLETYIRKLPAGRKQSFLRALYEDLSDSAKIRMKNSLTEDELAFLDIKESKSKNSNSPNVPAEKSIRTIADKIITRKFFTIQLIYCDAAKQAACNGKINPMGSIQCGTNYRARYDHIVRSFDFTGLIRESGQTQTKAYSNATIEDGKVSLWGRHLIFDADGDVFDGDCGRVGKLVLD